MARSPHLDAPPSAPPTALDLAAQADRSALLLLASNEGHWDWDVPTGAVWYSPRCHELLGFSDGELEPTIGATRTRLHPEDQARISALEERVLTQGAEALAVELRLRHRDGTYRWLLARFTVRRDGEGRPLRIAGSYQDITARKDAEARGDRLLEHLMEAQSVARIGSWSLHLATQRIFWSPQTFRIYGRAPAEEAPSFPAFLAQFDPQDREALLDRTRRATTMGEPYSSEFWVTWPDGSRHRLRGHGRAHRDAAGVVVELIGTVHDITEEHLAAERLRQAQAAAEAASRTKSQFLANMSHEIRTPMNSILGVLQVLQDAPLSDEQRGLLGGAMSAGETLIGLLNDFLDLAKIEAGKLELEQTTFLLRPLLKKMMATQSLAAKQKGLRLCMEVDDAVPEAVLGDPARLRQILFNLLGNALKFTVQGEIHLHAAVDEKDPGLLRCSVSDTGVGIPPDRLAAVFDAFTQADGSVTRRFGGTGLGLTICRGLVERMGGALTVTSTVGAGSVFTFTARLPAAAPPRPVEAAEGAPAAGRPLRILLAEDNALNARLMRGVLERLGHEVVCAADGSAAVSSWQRSAFSLVLMDVQMPEMDGLLATRTIRAMEQARGLPRTLIVALTANALRGDAEECLAAGMDDYLSKPVERPRLAAVLARAAQG